MSDLLTLISIQASASIRDAIQAIDRGTCEIALVVDEEKHLLGTVTDGDVRRALLREMTLEDPIEPIMNRNFTAVHEGVSRGEVLDLMRARTLEQIPILNSEDKLVGLHLMREIVGGRPLPNWAVIMAGGRGERLRPLTDSLPKPMVPVAGRPILERIVLHLVGHGIRRIYLAVNYMAEVIEKHFGDGEGFGCSVKYLKEETPLGTGGALSLLPEKPELPVLVLNGDLLTQADISGMLDFHLKGGHVATVGFHEYIHTIPYGVLDVNDDRVTGMREKPTQAWTANAGIYIFEPKLIRRVPGNKNFPLPALVEECLENNESVGAFRIAEEWMDVGHIRELSRARGEREEA